MLALSAQSRRLSPLRAHKIVATRRRAQTVYYRIADDETLALARALQRLIAQSCRMLPLRLYCRGPVIPS